jgi:hypothetical protein
MTSQGSASVILARLVSAQQFLTALFDAGIVISIGATVLSLGMTYTVGQPVAPLRADATKAHREPADRVSRGRSVDDVLRRDWIILIG